MKKKIILHGYLKDLYPHPIEVAADTIAEAVLFLSQIDELKRDPSNLHPVQIDGVNSEMALSVPFSGTEIHIRPRMTGGGGGDNGMIQIALGVALIAVAIAAGPGGVVLGMKASTVGLIGANLVIGGVLQYLMPTPEMDNGPSSRYLGAAQNTTAIGTTIAQVYGTRKVGGHYLSFDVDANVVKGVSNNNLFDKTATGTSVTAYRLPGGERLTKEQVAEMQVYLEKKYDFFDSEQDALYAIYDYTPLTSRPAVVCPEYSSAVASPTNIPTSGWAAEGQA